MMQAVRFCMKFVATVAVFALDRAPLQPPCCRAAAQLQLQQSGMQGPAVAALAVTRKHLLCAREGRNEILVCTHFQPGQIQQVLIVLGMDDITSIYSIVLGGREHDKLLVSSNDGKRTVVYLTPSEDAGSAVTEVVSEAHTAEVTGSAPGIGKHEVVTCSYDGRLCIWDCVSHKCAYKRMFTAQLSAVTSFPELGLLVAGSNAGVIRVVHGGPGLPVVWRSRVSDQPITQMISTMDSGSGVLAFISGAIVFLSTIDETGSLSGVKAVDTAGVPTALAFAHPVTGLRLLISLVASELVCVDVEDTLMPQGPSIPERRMRTHAPVTAMCCVDASAQSSMGRVCALSMDHWLRCGDLPSDASAWSTVKGRGTRLQDAFEVDSSVLGAQVVPISSKSGNKVVVVSRSGSIWSATMGSKSNASCVHVGDAAGRGISTAASNSLGSMLVTGCEDGSVIFSEVGDICKTADIEDTDHVVSDQTALKPDLDMADEHDEMIKQTQRPVEAPPASGISEAMQTSVEQNTIKFKLTTLKDKLRIVLQQNDQAVSTDQVPWNDLIIHTDLASRLRKAGKFGIAKLRRALTGSAVCAEVIGSRIRSECEADMKSQRQTTMGIRLPTVIQSYPQQKSACKQDELAHIRFLQAVEATEWCSTGRTGMAAAFKVQLAQEHTSKQRSEDDVVPAAKDLLDGTYCLYSDWDLPTVKRHIVVMRALEAQLLQHQSAFNAQLERIAKQRRDAEDVLHDHNQRLAEAAAELHSMGFSPSPEECKPIEVWRNERH